MPDEAPTKAQTPDPVDTKAGLQSINCKDAIGLPGKSIRKSSMETVLVGGEGNWGKSFR